MTGAGRTVRVLAVGRTRGGSALPVPMTVRFGDIQADEAKREAREARRAERAKAEISNGEKAS